MLNSPLAAPATADAQRLEMDQVRTTLSKQDPGQHRVDSRPSTATALATSIERDNCRSMDRACQPGTTFRCWAVNAAFLPGLHRSVVCQFGSHQTCSIAGFVAGRIVLRHERNISPCRARPANLVDVDHGIGCLESCGCRVVPTETALMHRRLPAELEVLLGRENSKDCRGAQQRPAFLC